MAALFATEAVTVPEHFIDDVLVADRGADHLAAKRANSGVHTGIAHDGGDDGFLGEFVAGKHVGGGYHEDIVAIDHRAGFIAEEDAIGVAVVSDAKLGAVFANALAHLLGMHRAAILVDVGAVGLVAVNEDVSAELAQD